MIDPTIPIAPDEAERRQSPSDSDWLAGGGEMGALIRSFDWSKTPVGPLHTWPQSLRTALGICLCSRFPMAIWWGPEIVQFYNDGYRPFLGIKHPRSMGQRGNECWKEIWDVCGPLYHHVMRTGESTWSADLQLLTDRNGYVEETYFTFAYSPIRGEMGDVQGNLITVTETTDRVIGERRLKTLRDLGAMATAAKTPSDACRIAADLLAGASSDIPFAALYLLEAEGRRARLFGVAGFERGMQASPETIDLPATDATGWPISQVVASRQSVVVEDLSRFGQLPTGPWADSPLIAMVLPLMTADGIVGAFVAGISPRHALDDSYRGFVDLLAGQIATGVANARAYEEERKRAELLAELARIRRQAEEAVREGESRFREMADSASVMVWVTEPDASCSFRSKSWYEFTGQTPEAGLGFGWLDAVHPDDRPRAHELFVAANAKQEAFQLDYRLRRKDGDYRWVIDSAVPRVSRSGRFLGYIGSVIDITERKRDEDAKDRLAAIVESSDDAIISKGLSGVITSWNTGAERLYGYTVQEAVGRPITMLMPPERLHEETVILDRIRRGERLQHYETVRRRKDGTLVDISLTVSPIVNSEGRIIGASKIARDITGRKKQEADLIARSMQQRLLYELANAVNRAGTLSDLYDKALDSIINALNADRAAILLFDDDGVMRFKAWRGLSSDYRRAVEGHSPWQRDTADPQAIVIGDIAKAEIAPELQEVIKREGIQALTFIPMTYRGRLLGKFMVYFNRSHTMDEEEVSLAHAIAGTLVLGIERKTAEEALLRLNDELETRIEKRTRELVASQARLRALAADLTVAEQRERQRLAAELHDYLAQLLALSKIKLGQAKQLPMSEPVSVSLGGVREVIDQALAYTRSLVAQLSPPVLHQFGLQPALKWLAEQMEERDLAVVLDIKQDIGPLPEDQAVLLFQSVRELLINVSKHGRTQQATVTVTEEDGLLRIVITDQGIGFNLAAASAAGPVPQSPATPGFGLFSIRERMAALGGQFSITSAPGQGTTAGLTLPLTPKTRNDELGIMNEELGMGSQSDHSPFHISHSSFHQDAIIRVLLVDDHAMVRQGLRGLLDGYSDIQVVGEATNGEEALALSVTLSPDVILMDVNMPKMDGVEATRRLARAGSDIRIIGLSVDNHAHIEQAMRDAGAAAFHTKEAAVEELYHSIQAVIGK